MAKVYYPSYTHNNGESTIINNSNIGRAVGLGYQAPYFVNISNPAALGGRWFGRKGSLKKHKISRKKKKKNLKKVSFSKKVLFF